MVPVLRSTDARDDVKSLDVDSMEEAESHFILEALADRPFRQSAPLIDEIRKQAAPQVEAPADETVQ